jgi:hypothetical protein
MGHGSDRYGYSRPDEPFAAHELAKMWDYTKPVAKSELEARDKQIQGLRADVQILHEFLGISGMKVQVSNGKLQSVYLGPGPPPEDEEVMKALRKRRPKDQRAKPGSET